MKKLYILGIMALAAIIIGLAWAEQITFSTYYPAPYGVYREMRATRMAVGDDYINGGTYDWDASPPTIDTNADLVVQGNVGIGTTDPEDSKGLGGYVDAQDVWLRDANSGAGAWASEAGGADLGGLVSRSRGTQYRADTNGFVLAYASSRGTQMWGRIGISSADTVVQRYIGNRGDYADHLYSHVIFPVPKNYYWRLDCEGAAVVYWMPLGG